MDIKDGEYIRTKLGTIAKIEDIEFDIKFKMDIGKPIYKNWKEDFGGSYVSYEAILKHSPNIIDLIEVGDYVNGSKVHHIREDVDDYGNDFKEINIENYCMLNYYIREEDIKSIVTKEMMKNVMYEV